MVGSDMERGARFEGAQVSCDAGLREFFAVAGADTVCGGARSMPAATKDLLMPQLRFRGHGLRG